ncbi:hypothetical protein BMW23_0896 [Bodo saltans virus]|uniref:Uncharacterized protein n=1 Tax=Bodo saltans virus TaxID=2024608 RepID=A0A2H4UVK0_9VIRU|nr:hypothetical protein QJ851_gp0878 [Bodo saltans virus]ATZ80941.1 hypothetical protein BMW23_0896 [Bodo saltans virus]
MSSMKPQITSDVPKSVQKEMKRLASQQMNVKPDVNAIPDLEELLSQIKKLLNDIESPQYIRLKESNKQEFERIIIHKYLETIPLKIINLMLEENRYSHLDTLLDMFDKLNNVKKGNINIDDAGKQIGEKMNEQYLYPKIDGGKEGFNKLLEKIKKENEENEENKNEDKDEENEN